MALRYLLDTSVFSQPIRPQPLPGCQTRWQRYGDASLAVPTITIAEIEYGLFLKDSDKLWTAYRTILKDRLASFDFTAPVASVFGEMKSRQSQLGRIVDDFDLAIAATAVAHDLTVATLNKRHFKLIEGVSLCLQFSPLRVLGVSAVQKRRPELNRANEADREICDPGNADLPIC